MRNQAVAAPAVKMQHHKVRTRRNQHRKAGTFILIGCILLAVITVLLVPFLVGGAAPASAAAAPSGEVTTERLGVEVGSLGEATQALGFDAAIPASFPDGYTIGTVNVVDGEVLELEITSESGRAPVIYRTATGSDDLTWDETEYPFTITEEVEGVTRSYAGVAEQKLSVALWADGGYSYALVAPDGMDAESLHLIAESIG